MDQTSSHFRETLHPAADFPRILNLGHVGFASVVTAICRGLVICSSAALLGQSQTTAPQARVATAPWPPARDQGRAVWASSNQRTDAVRAISETIDAADLAWNHGDTKAWTSHYSSRARWVNASSRARRTVISRPQVEKMLPRSQFEFHPYTRTQTWIRFIAPNRAEVHSHIQFTRGKPVAPFADGPTVQLLTLEGGTWRIVGQYNGAIPHSNICGIIGNACCSGWRSGGFGPPLHINFCNSNAVCSGNNTCVAAPPAPACGGAGEQCCRDPNSEDTAYDYCTDPKTGCYPWQGPHGTCNPCGTAGQSVCPFTGCASGTVARHEVCLACGGAGQPCCSHGCTGGTICSVSALYTCTACGEEGQAPCAGNICYENLHPDFEDGKTVCTANCGYTQGAPCTLGADGCDNTGHLTGPQNPCVQPLVGTDLSNGGIYDCYGTYPQNSMIDTDGNCNCVPNMMNTCPVSSSVPKPPVNNTGLCIQGQFFDISGHGCS